MSRAAGTERLDRLVAARWPISRTRARQLIEAGDVEVDGEVVTKASVHVSVAADIEVDVVYEVTPAPEPDPAVAVSVAHEDDHVIVVDKPAGLVVHPGHGNPDGTLVNGLLARYPELADVGDPDRPGLVHRLDAGTSGLLAVGRTADAHAALVDAMKERHIERRYVALVHGLVPEAAGRIEGPIGRDPRAPTRMAVTVDGRPAVTHYEVDRRWSQFDELPDDALSDGCTLLRCRLETGRTHQIRVHVAAIDHPIVGDPLYGGDEALSLDRPFLHAASLRFDHPVTGEDVAVESPLPPELVAALERLDAGQPG